jgi:flagellar FliJ protein
MYKFEFDKILEIRKHIENSIYAELNAVEKLLDDEKKRFKNNKEKRQDLSNLIQEKLSNGASSDEYLLYSSFISKINLNLEMNIKSISEIEEKRNNKRQELINAVKNRKSLENLKIKRTNEYMKTMQKIETSNLDDFASSQYTRRMDNR